MKYRNARTKTGEMVVQWLIIPLALVSLVLAFLWNGTRGFLMTAMWIDLLIAGMFLFFLWDTKNIPHTVDLEDDQFTVIRRSGEETIRWKDIDDLLWKKVVAKRCVVGLYLESGDQIWLRSIRPAVAEALERRWKKV